MKKIITTALISFALLSSAFAIEPALYDLVMQAGEDFRSSLQLKDGSGRNTNLTGYSYRSQFRSAPAPAGTVFATMSAIFTNVTGGRLDLRLSKAQTNTNSGRAGVWDLQQTDPSGVVTYIIKGKAAVTPTVTR